MRNLLATLALGAASTLAFGSGPEVPINVSDLANWDLVGDTDNVVLTLDVAAALGFPAGTPCTMNGVGWDVEINAMGESWLSEARIYFDDNVAPDGTGVFLRPGAGTVNDHPGIERFTSPVIKLTDVGIAVIPLPDGVLRMELHESFDDVANGIDSAYGANSTIIVQVIPEPASLGLLAIGGLALLRRR